MDKFRVFVYMVMRDESLKQRIPCIISISIFGAFSGEKKCELYTGKYGNVTSSLRYLCLFGLIFLDFRYLSNCRWCLGQDKV